MAAIGIVNPKAEYARGSEAFSVNLSAARGLQEIMKPNLGPKGTLKMLVSGAGEITITKDGGELLKSMQITHPTASLIARTSAAMDSNTGDGVTSTVLLIGEILKKSDPYLSEGVHPRIIVNGLTEGRKHIADALKSIAIPLNYGRDMLSQIAKVSLQSKLPLETADTLVDVCVDAFMSVYNPVCDSVDLNMIEIMVMQHKLQIDTRLVKGLVLDHGARHAAMPKSVRNARILTCNVSLEYEKTEVNSGFFYKTAEEREIMVKAEREFIEERVKKIIELKRKVCTGDDASFVVINLKGIDPLSLEMLAKENIIALRRAKRRNMERLMLACGGSATNSVDDLTEECLGKAGKVYEHALGENKYTFVEDCQNPKSVTILVHGPSSYATKQIELAVKDALRAMANAVHDGIVLPGGGATEIALGKHLTKLSGTADPKIKLGLQILAESLQVIPLTLAANSGLDPRDTMATLDCESFRQTSTDVGLDLATGRPAFTAALGIYDNFCVKRQSIVSAAVVASNFLLVDDIMRAGLSSLKGE